MKQEIYSYKRQLNDLIAEVNTLNMEIAQNNEDYVRIGVMVVAQHI